MVIQDVFDIAGRGLVCTGRIECGKIKVGDLVNLEYKNGSTIKNTSRLPELRNSEVSCKKQRPVSMSVFC